MGKLQVKLSQMKKYMKLVGNVVSALSILFVLYVLVRTDFHFSNVFSWRNFLLACFFGIVIKTVTVFLSGSAWAAWLSFFASKRCSRKEALRVYAKANLGKYMPGNVMHYVERNLFAGKLAMSQKKVAASSICEVATLVFTAFLMGIVFACPAIKNVVARQAVLKKGLMFGCVVVGILILAVMVFVSFNRNKYGQERPFVWEKCEKCKPFVQTMLRCMLLYVAVLTGLGIIFVLLYCYQGGQLSLGQAFSMIASYTAAWAVGFVVPGAPGGIGVRELALITLLENSIGTDVVVTLGVWHRLITVIGDLTAYVVAIWIGKSRGL